VLEVLPSHSDTHGRGLHPVRPPRHPGCGANRRGGGRVASLRETLADGFLQDLVSPLGGTGRRRAEAAHPCEHGPIAENGNHDGTPNGHDVEEGDDETESGFERWRRESALGAVGTGIAKGLRDVFAPTDDHQVIVAEVPGDPPDSGERVRVILDPDDPTKAVAYVPKPAERDDESPPEPGPADADPAG
jgi:hypothetical protein